MLDVFLAGPHDLDRTIDMLGDLDGSLGRRAFDHWLEAGQHVRQSQRPTTEGISMKKTFSEKVRDIVRKIPKGKTMTYEEVASKVGNPNAARAVGAVMRSNYDPSIPCHRVVASEAWRPPSSWLPRLRVGDRETGEIMAIHARGENLSTELPNSMMRCVCGVDFDSHKPDESYPHRAQVYAAYDNRGFRK